IRKWVIVAALREAQERQRAASIDERRQSSRLEIAGGHKTAATVHGLSAAIIPSREACIARPSDPTPPRLMLIRSVNVNWGTRLLALDHRRPQVGGLCTKNTSRALIERPYSCAPQAVGAVYDRPGFFVQSQGRNDQ